MTRRPFIFDVMQPRESWRDKVNHESPRAQKVRAAVLAIHARGEYPGCRRVMNELGDELYRTTYPYGEDIPILATRWMNGRDNVVRHRVMKELGIKVEAHPNSDGGYEDHWSYGY